MILSRPYALATICCLALAGCSRGREMGQVSGTVTYKGKPLPEGSVMFVPDNGPASGGAIDSQGRYRLSTLKPYDGALVGTHKVCVIPPYQPQTSGYPEFDRKYQSQETSGWERTVVAGENNFDFDIPE